MKQVVPGLAIGIVSDVGIAVGLVTHVYAKLEDVVWISQTTFGSMPSLDETRAITTWRWPVLLAVRAFVRHHLADVIGEVDLPPELRLPPQFRGGNRSDGWRKAIIEASGDTQPGPRTEDRNLPPLQTLNAVALKERIVSGWMPADLW